jgi:hypothetical protein
LHTSIHVESIFGVESFALRERGMNKYFAGRFLKGTARFCVRSQISIFVTQQRHQTYFFRATTTIILNFTTKTFKEFY